ncbi:AAA family ATPase [Brevibacillus sp. B_LB10_24]|uniref:AAA family ATPase n=1 Tax=Brevibacillus sp. B_LB10_24 TaxID=3380645 RepID=UPI0038B6CBCC
MHMTEETDRIAAILDGEISPEQVSERDAIGLLSQVAMERKHGETEKAKLDRAEAFLLTCLAQSRWQKADGLQQAMEWIDKAMELDPRLKQAALLAARLAIASLARLDVVSGLPAIRETDNAATRKQHIRTLLEKISEHLQGFTQWDELLHRAQAAVSVAEDKAVEEILGRLAPLLAELKGAMQDLVVHAIAYAESLQGVFYSSELLKNVQSAIQKLSGLQGQWTETLGSQLDAEEPAAAPKVRSALAELDELIGMTEIKARVKQWAGYLRYQRLRREKGWMMQDEPELHAVLMGNPGTGKTTLARLLARLYHELGLLGRDEVVEVDRSHLVGSYLGQTEQRTMDAVKRAVGGVLFIDEAYSLKRPDSHGGDYGQVAIDTLVAAMTSGEYAGKFVVILAGYPEEMRHFLEANPGLRSRFPETGHFVLPDYNDEELLAIAEHIASRNDFFFSEAAKRAMLQRLERERVDETFGNARTARNIVLDAIFSKGRGMDADKELQVNDFTVLYPEDVDPRSETEGRRPSEKPRKYATAREQLQELVGLGEVKAEMEKLAAYLRIQQMRHQKGLPVVPLHLNAVFTGNPGTGKTTVAQLYAQLLKETGHLKRGHLVSVSRSDLVAGFVGQTALKTRRKVREALGGVLFIDEAYALLTGSENDFGQEAINTLVEEMTKHEDNLVVVLAGYQQEMERLIASNPGLASRFAKFFAFPDYTPAELQQMMLGLLQAQGYRLEQAAADRLLDRLIDMERQGRLHGNGRLIRNLSEAALQQQAVRLGLIDADELTPDALSQLVWEDFAPVLE